uniref:STM1-like N-terminal domain-containing protein n=1 Tax=Aegilops tauschii TaxID=37682 RepID=M8AZE5_AEGTA
MTTLNQFDLLGDIDNDDPSHLLAAAAAAAAKKALANKTEAAPAGKAGQTVAAAKLPTKPAPLAQAGEALRRSLHHHRHHAVMLSELIHYLAVLLDQEGADVAELNVC